METVPLARSRMLNIGKGSSQPERAWVMLFDCQKWLQVDIFILSNSTCAWLINLDRNKTKQKKINWIRELQKHCFFKIESVMLYQRHRVAFKHYIKTREGLGEFETVMQTENSPNASSVYIMLCKHGKKVFYCFYKITFPKTKRKTLCMALIKREIFTSRKSCPRSRARVISSRLQKDALQNTNFSRLKCQLKRRKIDSPSL